MTDENVNQKLKIIENDENITKLHAVKIRKNSVTSI